MLSATALGIFSGEQSERRAASVHDLADRKADGLADARDNGNVLDGIAVATPDRLGALDDAADAAKIHVQVEVAVAKQGIGLQHGARLGGFFNMGKRAQRLFVLQEQSASRSWKGKASM